MAFNNNITPGSPPLLWSNMDSALRQINENFDILVATIGAGSGLIPLDFNTLDSNVSPASDNSYSLGNSTNKWRSVYTSEWSNVGLDQLNGVWLGSAQIKGIGSVVDLPSGSTVDGNLIIDPNKTFFKSAQVDDGDRIEANEFSDTLNFLSGNGIALTVGSPGESITISNDGIIEVTAGLGIVVNTVLGSSQITNDGVRSLQNLGTLPSGRAVGAGIYVDATKGDNVKITNTGILGFDNSGFGTVISVDAATGLATVGLSPGVVTTAAFRTISVTGEPNIEADGPADTLTITPGYGVLISTNALADTITLSVNPEIDIKGSVVGNDSSVIVDAEDRKVYADLIGNVTGNVAGGTVSASTLRTSEAQIALGNTAGQTNQGLGTIAIGSAAGQSNQGISSIAIGTQAAQTNQGVSAVAIGTQSGSISQGAAATAVGTLAGNSNQGLGAVALGQTSGSTNQGQYAVAIGSLAGSMNQPANSIVINASGSVLDGSAAGFFVDPIRSTATATGPMMYNPTTKELFYNTVLEFAGSTISTNDSSGITVDVQTTFNTDVVFENDITVAERLTVKGSRVINLVELKSIVAASTSFSDFQTRIAALA